MHTIMFIKWRKYSGTILWRQVEGFVVSETNLIWAQPFKFVVIYVSRCGGHGLPVRYQPAVLVNAAVQTWTRIHSGEGVLDVGRDRTKQTSSGRDWRDRQLSHLSRLSFLSSEAPGHGGRHLDGLLCIVTLRHASDIAAGI